MSLNNSLSLKSIDRFVTPIAILLSCLLCIFLQAAHELINDDAYVFLKGVEIFREQGMTALSEFYGWPGYPLLLAFTDSFLPYDTIFAAYVINMAAFGLLTYAFIALVNEYQMESTVRAKIIAAIAILVFPEISELRHALVRDPGMWAFGVLALVQLIRFSKHGSYLNAFGFAVSLIAAICFRIEALVYLIISPVLLLFIQTISWNERISLARKLIYVLAALAFLIYILASLLGANLLEELRYAYRYYILGLNDFTDGLAVTARQMGEVIFNDKHLSGDFQQVNVAGLVLAYCYSFIVAVFRVLGLPITCVLLYGFWHKKIQLPGNVSTLVTAFMTVSALMLLFFILIMHFMVQRYADFLGILLLSLAVLVVDNQYQRAQRSGSLKRFYKIFGTLGIYLLLDSTISMGASKSHLENSITWLDTNLPEAQTFYTNNRSIAYFSKHVKDYDKVERAEIGFLENLAVSDIVAVEISRGQDELLSRLANDSSLQQLAEFKNNKYSRVIILQKITDSE